MVGRPSRGGRGNEHDREDTPPTSPHDMLDRSSTETGVLTPNLSSLSLLPTPLDRIGLSPSTGCPEGLSAIHDHITEEEESSLLAFLSLQTWTDLGTREECQYGYGYLHGERRVVSTNSIPKEFSVDPNQIIALRYVAPYHLPAHVDAHVFDDTVHTLCLGSGVVLIFHDGEDRYDMEHPRRALVTMKGHSRYSCTHCILSGDTDTMGGEVVKRKTRYALTFRRVLDAHLPPSPIHIE